MFFSEDLLSSKKGSFGIVWLAATLGPRTKRITRKQLISVDLNRTCELIAQPPEPMALRLSGCLLVGVARVYHQNYDLFYSDVTKIHSDLRRMVMTEFGNHFGPDGQPVGLDLMGDGKAKHDSITFDGEDVTWAAGIDLSLLKMDWSKPELLSRKRRTSTQISSLPSQKTQEERGGHQDSDQDSEDEDEDDQETVDPEGGRRARLRQPPSSPYGPRSRNSGPKLDRNSQTDGILPDLEDLFIIDPPSGSDDLQPLGVSSQSLMEPDQPFIPDDYVPDILGDLPMPEIDRLDPTIPQSDEIHLQNGGPGTKRLNEDENGEDPAPKKPKRVKKAKKARFDDDLELELDVYKGKTYAHDMDRDRVEQKSKGRAKEVEEMANAMVDGAGQWIEFLDPGLSDLFATVSRPGKFKWESDVRNDDIAKIVGVNDQNDQPLPPMDGMDPFTMMDITNQDTTYQEEIIEYDVPIKDSSARAGSQRPESELEMGRRVSQGQPLDSQLPWSEANDDFGDALPSVDDYSPGRSLSHMTPLEKRIRSSGARSSMLDRARRDRSQSVLGDRARDPQQLVPDDQADDHELPEDPFATQNLPPSQMRPELPEAFQPHMLASLEPQCRSFMMFTERQMRKNEVDELEFGEVISDTYGKRVAALAFYNCLTLTTKKVLSVSQPIPWEAITIRFTADL